LSEAKARTVHDDNDVDPLRMYLVVRRGAIEELDRLGQLAGAAAVACLREFAESHAEAIAAWTPRPGKVVLRARSPSQWARVLEEPHAGDEDAVVALPPRRRSERGDALTKLQAMSTALTPPAAEGRGPVTYALNPRIRMSTGKTLAQIAHAAVLAAADEDWVRAGCPARVIAPDEAGWDALTGSAECAGEIADAGLTEIAPGTITVRLLSGASRR
jgi:hypothetical protein